jgi:HK97 family phage major capsid protein
MSANPQEEFRALAAELKEAVLTKNEEAQHKINDRLDSIELGLKAVAKGTKATEQTEDIDNFVSALKVFGKDGAMKAQEQFADVKVGARRNGQIKSDNLVRFDYSAAGALLLPAQMSDDINKQVVEFSPVIQVARVIDINAPSYKQALRNTSLTASWRGEDTAASKTKDGFGSVDIPLHSLSAYVGWTIEQERDSAYDLAGEINSSVIEQEAAATGTAFINGDGVNKPTGLVGNVSNFNTGSQALTSDLIIRMQAQIKSAYQANASWMANRLTWAYVRQLVLSSTNGLQYTWEPSFQAGRPSRLLGSEIFEAPDLVGLTNGNFTVGNVPILYGDFARGYVVTRSTDRYIIRDPYTDASSGVVNLFVNSRYGGDVVRSEAIVQMTIS